MITGGCSCNVPVITEIDEQGDIGSGSLFTILDICIGPAVGPCVCSTTECRVSLT